MTLLRDVAAVLGGVVVILTSISVLRTLIVPRASIGRIARIVDLVTDAAFRVATRRVRSYEERDTILAAQAAVYLVVLLATWLAGYFVGYGLLLWPATHHIGYAFRECASSMFTLGFVPPASKETVAVDVLAAASGLFVIAAQIGYLPTLYGAFNRRETEVTLLGSRAGTPPWGPELLARTKYGIGSHADDLPAFYAAWERWAADVAESHANYPILMRFRSPQPLSSWLVGLLAVMDSAAMLLAVAPSRERLEPRLCIRMGFTALQQMGRAVGMPVDHDPDPDGQTILTFEEFRAGVQRLLDVGFEVERTAEEAWPHFKGWRVNYEPIAYTLAYKTDAVPALWSGPRRWPHEPMPPVRPPNRAPGGDTPSVKKPALPAARRQK
ncbi:MAG TPA: hypothetical protein VHC43_00335 [Mycobacteriales bacterium]|nr:hypothetical protein [Mycobacteriales bacterium]